MRKIATLIIAICLLNGLFAQKTTVSVKLEQLKTSLGNWKGSLTYLDYQTAKPFTMQANIGTAFTEDQKGYIMRFEYPKEPHANSSDTTYLSNGHFGKEAITEFVQDAGSYTMVTEVKGKDGNDNQSALIRHTYRVTPATFNIIKEVKFDGTSKWIKRNEYSFTR
jgi:hypothetical protein